jgi:predicted heme/steroid binding protein
LNHDDLAMCGIYNNVQYYLQKLKYGKNFLTSDLEYLINEINQMYVFHQFYINQLKQIRYLNNSKMDNKKFTIADLSYYDGSNGKAAYVAVHGIVYDVSLEATWGGGTHFKLYSGKDLSKQFTSCHNLEVLKKLPKVGVLIDTFEE